jgi:hypothetical protein
MPTRPVLAAAVALLALLAVLPAGARAQTPGPPVLTGAVSPARGGSAKKPASAIVGLQLALPADRRATVSRVTYRMPAGVRLSGTGFPTCTAEQVALAGEGRCPQGARVGSVLIDGTLSTAPAVPATWTGNVYAASSTAVTVVLKGLTSGPFEAALSGRGRRLTLALPIGIREPFDDYFSRPEAIALVLGGTRTTGSGSKRRTFRFATLTGCPADRTHDLVAELAYAPNDAGPAPGLDRLAATARCRR